MAIQTKVTSNMAAVLKQIQKARAETLAALRKGLDLEQNRTIRALTLGRMGFSSAGPVQSNGLRRISSTAVRSLRFIPAVNDGNGVVSELGSNLRYVIAHEKGFNGDVFIRAHFRRLFKYGRARMVKFINPVTGLEGTQRKRSRRVLKDEFGDDRETIVVAHQRHMAMPARHMIRDTLIERIPAYNATFAKAVPAMWEGLLAPARTARLEPTK